MPQRDRRQLPRVIKIDHVEPPFFVYTVWTNGEKRKNDIGPVIADCEAAGSGMFSPLRDWEIFNKVSASDNGTIQWESVMLTHPMLNGEIISEPLDLDPEVLYAEGELIEPGFERPNLENYLKKDEEGRWTVANPIN